VRFNHNNGEDREISPIIRLVAIITLQLFTGIPPLWPYKPDVKLDSKAKLVYFCLPAPKRM